MKLFKAAFQVIIFIITPFIPLLASDLTAYDILVLQNKNYHKTSLERSLLPAANTAVSLVRFYQRYISPLNGARCMFYPTCSKFFLDATFRYGLFWGIIMTTDRMFYRENIHSIKNYPYLKSFGSYLDPVENNFIFNDH